VGETPNVAARLQGIAAPDTVVIAEGTRRLLGDLFELEDLGSKDLKVSPGRHGPGRRSGRAPWRAVSRRSPTHRAVGVGAGVAAVRPLLASLGHLQERKLNGAALAGC
jgi:hypothetical protein